VVLPKAGPPGDDHYLGDECNPKRCFLAVGQCQLRPLLNPSDGLIAVNEGPGWPSHGERPELLGDFALGSVKCSKEDATTAFEIVGVGTGINQAELARLWRHLQLLATPKMPLDVPPPRSTRFGSPLVLSLVVGTALRSATYSEGVLSGIGAPQPSVSSRKADRQFRVTVSWAQLRN
jgi:hypothetical protein